jgi:hypothetical protein
VVDAAARWRERAGDAALLAGRAEVEKNSPTTRR